MIKYHEEPNPDAQYDEEWITVENQDKDVSIKTSENEKYLIF